MGNQSRLLMALTFWSTLVLWVEVDGLLPKAAVIPAQVGLGSEQTLSPGPGQGCGPAPRTGKGLAPTSEA